MYLCSNCARTRPARVISVIRMGVALAKNAGKVTLAPDTTDTTDTMTPGSAVAFWHELRPVITTGAEVMDRILSREVR